MAGMNIREDVLNQVPKPKMTGRDVAYRALAAALGGPVDLTSLFMAPFGYDVKEPVGGSEWIGRQMQDVGLVSEARDPLTEFVASLAVPGPGSGTALAHGAMGLPALAGVVKAKGGNWLTGSVEDAVKGLKRHTDPILDGMAAEGRMLTPAERRMVTNNPASESINEFVDKQLTRYIKNQMATPEDPVRALAEKGVLHFDPPTNRSMSANSTRHVSRTSGAYPQAGITTLPDTPARYWEDAADASAMGARYGDSIPFSPGGGREVQLRELGGQFAVDNPDATAYSFNRGATMGDLGFDHLTDELYNAARSNSDLPRELQLKPESIKRMGVPQAVEHVAKINKWRADQMAEANAKIAKNPATQMFKEYPVVPGTGAPNGRGLHWVELKAPKETGKKSQVTDTEAYGLDPEVFQMQLEDEAIAQGLTGDAVDQYVKEKMGKGISVDESHKILQEALKYEGDTMGHCVGGYCDEVMSGNTKIYSLRDAKGEPHVTVEVAPSIPEGYTLSYAPVNIRDEAARALGFESYAKMPSTGANLRAAEDKAREIFGSQYQIKQIKGKGNKAPKDEYLPFVQDFVRSGKWSGIGDLKNTGLLEASPARYTQPEGAGSGWMPRFDELDIEPGYYTNQELVDAIQRARAKQR